jgi:hypothetical protein
VKSGWAAAVLLKGPIHSPNLCRSFEIDLCDPDRSATRQPYHAAMGKLETDGAKLKAQLQIVHRATEQSVANLLADCRRDGLKIRRAGLVAGTINDPTLIASPHVRAHALEGQLFRTALGDALRARRVRTLIMIERNAYERAADKLKKPIDDVRRAIQHLGQTAKGSWRAEQKLAAVAAWMALAQ